jgi:hypothetical protein
MRKRTEHRAGLAYPKRSEEPSLGGEEFKLQRQLEPLAKPPNLSVFLDLACPKKVAVSKLYPMESSAKTQHFQ